MLSKPCSAPSIKYIKDPNMTVSVNTVNRNTVILRRLATSERISTSASRTWAASFNTRNVRRIRNTRITARTRAAGNSTTK